MSAIKTVAGQYKVYVERWGCLILSDAGVVVARAEFSPGLNRSEIESAVKLLVGLANVGAASVGDSEDRRDPPSESH